MTPHYVMQVAMRMAEAQDRLIGTHNQIRNRLEDIQWYREYASQDGKPVGTPTKEQWTYTPKGIVAGDWNDPDMYDPESQKRIVVTDLLSRLERIFEKMGLVIEWSDTVTGCHGCNRCIQTEPDHYGWKPAFVVTESEILCLECAPEKYTLDDQEKRILEILEENASRCCDDEDDRVALAKAIAKGLKDDSV